MSVTASDLVTRALKGLEVVGGTETPTAQDATDALTALNAMIDSWNTEFLACYEVQEQSFSLVIGTTQYSIGSGGTINVTRPIRIVDAYLQDTNQNNYPFKIVERPQWNQIGLRNVTSNLPDTLFYDPQYPLGYINIFPSPLEAYMVFFDSYLQLSQLSSLSTALSTPPGYERAYVYNLMVEIHNMFSIPIPPSKKDIFDIARESKANIKRANMRDVVSEYDSETISRANASYNVFRDNF